MKKFTALFTLLLLCSCATSNMSKNTTKQGNFVLNGGKAGDKTWSDSLIFKRQSWYKELALLFDVQLARLDSDSPFLAWFSDKEKENYNECKDFIIAISYTLDSKRISQPMFIEEMKKQGFSRVSLNTFHSYLRLHPDFESFSLTNYEVYGLCGNQKARPEGISIQFPSFEPLWFK